MADIEVTPLDALKAFQARMDRQMKALTKRVSQLETAVNTIFRWVAERDREKAQKAIDDKNRPVVHHRQEGGEVWLKARTCIQCGHVLVKDSSKGFDVCPREGCQWYGKLQ